MSAESFCNGHLAAKSGAKATSNPYKPATAMGDDGVQLYADWLDGYLLHKGYDFSKEPYKKQEIEQYHGHVGIDVI